MSDRKGCCVLTVTGWPVGVFFDEAASERGEGLTYAEAQEAMRKAKAEHREAEIHAAKLDAIRRITRDDTTNLIEAMR